MSSTSQKDPGTPSSGASDHPRRTAIHRFSLVRRLGSGAMGMVYEAIDPLVQGRVALKVLRNADPELLVRFKREFRLVKALSHPNLVTLGELFSEDEEWFFTMELVEGTDLLSYVRGGLSAAMGGMRDRAVSEAEHKTTLHDRVSASGGVPFDEKRLREALLQLTSALEVTHAAGIIHRDVKPSNVLVTRGGRVVVLDFGVAADMHPGAPTSTTASLVGTPAYMSPEQAVSGAASSATDMYSVGVMLFEALTGVRPFEGSAIDVMTRKQTALRESPRQILPDVPEDLDRLTMELLAIAPQARPTARDVRERLGDVRASQRPSDGATTSRGKRLFVGREAEMATLERAYAESRAGSAVVVLVRGESGIGKSVLVDHFVRGVEADAPDVVVLQGKCRENESIPFKAFDGIMDDLVRLLVRMPREAAAILPARAEQLAQVFPVFRQVVAARPRMKPLAEDPTDSRSRLFTCVRELFARLVERFPVVVTIDDIQWTDADSLALLHELARPPDAPSALVLITERTESNAKEAPELTVRDLRVIEMARLSAADSVALVREMAKGSQDPADDGAPPSGASDARGLRVDAEAIALEAQGHPMFIAELVRYSATARGDSSALRLDDALGERLRTLDADTRKILNLVALAGRPVTLAFLSHAASLPHDGVARVVATLRSLHALRSSGARGDLVEPYHDRIREVSLKALTPVERPELHRRIAATLETSDRRDLEALAFHWGGAGDRERALSYAAEAAREASEALAFDRAARLYESILATPLSPADEAMFATKLGEARVNGGHSAAAAAAFKRAAQKTSRIEALPLLQRTAEQELRAGLIAQGLQTIGDVLTSLGIAPPRALWLTLVSFLFWRVVLRMRGVDFVRRSIDEIQPRQLTKIDVCWSLAFSLSAIDPIRGSHFQTRQLLLALQTGEPVRVARALSMELPYMAGPGAASWRRTEVLVTRCRALVKEVNDPLITGLATGMIGIACYLSGRFTESLALIDEGVGLLRECTGVWGETTRMRRFATSALAVTGRFRELCARTTEHTKESQERGDLHALTNLAIGHAQLAWLVTNQPHEGRAVMRAAMAKWTNPGFHLEHLYELYAEVNIDLYLGEPAAAYARVADRWPALQASVLLHIPSARIICEEARARAAVALAAVDPARRRGLLAEARKIGKRLGGEATHATWPRGAILRAGAAKVEGNLDEAAQLLRECVARFDEHGMAYLAAASRRALGGIVGGAKGSELVGQAEAKMKAEGIVDMERFADVWAPGLGEQSHG